MNIKEHKKKFEEIIKKYNLYDKNIAKEISEYLTKNKTTVKDFAIKYNMKQKDAEIFLNFIKKGIEFKEKNIDKNN